MKYEWDPKKALHNLEKHTVAFDTIGGFDWDTAYTKTVNRSPYGEKRYQSVGWIGDRLHKVVFIYRDGSIRIISMGKANRRDQRKYHARDRQIP